LKILFAGDTHGSQYDIAKLFQKAVWTDAERIFQVGDYGVGVAMGRYPDAEGKWAPRCAVTHKVAQLVQETGIPFDFIDGNHEDHDYLESCALVEKDGFRTLEDGVRHATRGTAFEWDGVKFLACGGAVSVDKKWRLERSARGHRGWWFPQEAITPEDVERCKAQGEADVLIIHDAPYESHIMDGWDPGRWPREQLDESYKNRMYLREVTTSAKPEMVIHGHLHVPYREITPDFYIVGLDKCDQPFDQCTYLFDTETWRAEISVLRYYDDAQS
jgi:predicted phosphodiesterase